MSNITEKEYSYLLLDATPEERKTILEQKYGLTDKTVNGELLSLVLYMIDDIRDIMVYDGII